jgi:tyrosyl-tRNA synthetase
LATDLYEDLQWRGMVSEVTDGLREAMAAGSITAYIGFDPTADSLHVGSLLTMIGLARLQRFGHSPIAIVGGGTGMIGDPKPTQERPLLSREDIERNVAGIKPQLAKLLDFDSSTNPARIINNADWLAAFDLLGFLRDTGKYFTVNYLLQKEAVSRRLESDEGISFTEFSYPLLQARDYVELFDRYNCTLQMGGTDQWGNITAGIDLVRKLRARRVHGLVWPLLTTAAGTKFGKTEAGTVWLDPNRTSPFRFYQFWLNTDDRDVVRLLKFYTFMTKDEIDELARATEERPQAREAQRTLARTVTAMVHGDEQVRRAEQAAQVLFGGSFEGVSVDDILMVFDDAPSTELALPPDGMSLAEMLATVKLVPSKSEAVRLLKSGGVYVNNVRAADEKARLTAAEAIGGTLFVLRKGRKDHHIVKLRVPERA